MPVHIADASTGGATLVFPGDAAGCRFRIRETALYDAEEVRAHLDHDDDDPPQYGRWVPVSIEGEDSWLATPGELVEELQRLEPEPGEIFEVTRIKKSGNKETDPFEVNLERLSDEAQTRF